MNNLKPVIYRHIQMKPDGEMTNWKEILQLPEMRLAIIQMEGYKQGLDAYDTVIAKCQLIIKEIDKEGE